MTIETMGTVVSCATQWWLKINTKPFRVVGSDGAIYPHILKVRYSVDGKDYVKRKWLSEWRAAPSIGESVKVAYDEEKPERAKILY